MLPIDSPLHEHRDNSDQKTPAQSSPKSGADGCSLQGVPENSTHSSSRTRRETLESDKRQRETDSDAKKGIEVLVDDLKFGFS
jgi:hypothetical protein